MAGRPPGIYPVREPLKARIVVTLRGFALGLSWGDLVDILGQRGTLEAALAELIAAGTVRTRQQELEIRPRRPYRRVVTVYYLTSDLT